MKSRIASVVLVALASLALAPRLHAQAAGTAFTYQGRLADNGVPATGTYDFEFRLYDVPSGGIPIAATTEGDVTVTGGLFTVRLDFGGSIFTGPPRYLEPAVRPGTSEGGFTGLLPRQELTPGPYAMRAESAAAAETAASADDADALDGFDSSAFLALAENETVTGTPAFNGGTTGVSPPFTVDSTFVVANLNADVLDGFSSASFLRSDASTTFSTGTLTLAVGTTFSLPLGSATAPSLNFTGDTDTGIFSTGPNTIALATSGVEGLRVDSTGDLLVRDRLFLAGNTNESLSYDAVQARHEFSSPLALSGALNAGSTSTVKAYNSFGTGAAGDAAILNLNDVYVTGDLEVDGALIAGANMNVPDGFVINVAGSPANLTINGLNAVFQIGDTGADKVGIGRPPATNSLEVNGNASKTTAGDWLANSDRRLKTDIEGLTDALGVVRRLRPVRFRYSEEFRRKHPSVKHVYYHNYVAQEFQQVFADSVQDDGEGFLQMDAHPANIYAVGAIQELDRLLTEKDATIAALERRLALLEDAFAKRIAAMEKTLAVGNGGAARTEAEAADSPRAR